MNIKGTLSIINFKLPEVPEIVIGIKGSSTYSININENLVIYSNSTSSSCFTSNYSHIYQWKQISHSESIIFIDKKNGMLSFDVFTFPDRSTERTYSFELKIVMSFPFTTVTKTSSKNISITVEQWDIVSKIKGSNRAIPSTYVLKLDGTESYDPDSIKDEIEQYSWRYLNIKYNSMSVLNESIFMNQSILTIPSNSLNISNYKFTLKYSKVVRTSESFVLITLTKEDAPQLLIETSKSICNSNEKIILYGNAVSLSLNRDLKYEWSILNNKINLTNSILLPNNGISSKDLKLKLFSLKEVKIMNSHYWQEWIRVIKNFEHNNN